MKFLKSSVITIATALIGLSTLPVWAGAEKINVEVSTIEPYKLGDIELSNYSVKQSAKQIKKDMARLLEELAKDYLDPGSKIKINITKLDLPGYIEWNTGNASNIRVIRQNDFMKIRFEYDVIDANGNPLIKGSETLKEFYEAPGIPKRIQRAGSAEYFRDLFEDWMKEKIASK